MKPRIPAWAGLLLAVVAFGLVGGYTLLAVPVGEGPDEYGHIAYAVHMAAAGLPDPAEDKVAMDHHPPLYYALGAAAIKGLYRVPAGAWDDRSEVVMRPGGLPGPYRTELQFVTPKGATGPVRSPAYAVRLVSLLFGMVLVIALGYGAYRAFGGHRRATAAALGWAFLPGVVFSAAVVSNDMAVAAVSTVAYALYFRVLKGRFLDRPWHGLVLGAVLGAAAMLKTSGLIPALLLPVAVALAWSLPGNRTRWIQGGVAWLVLVVVMVTGQFYLVNAVEQHDLFLTRFLVADRPELAVAFPVTENYLGHVLARLFRGYLGELGHQEVELARPLLLLFLVVAGAAAGGVLLRVRDAWLAWRARGRPGSPGMPATTETPERSSKPRNDPAPPFMLADDPRTVHVDEARETDPAPPGPDGPPLLSGRAFAFCLVAVGVTVALLLQWNTLFYGPYGRYLHVVLLPLTVLVVAGVHRLTGPGAFRVAAPILGLLPPVALLYTLFFSLLPHYYTPWSRWTRGEVVYYDDGGHPRAEPHLVKDTSPGRDFEPWGTYSRYRVPEMNLAWGAPEVKFRYEGLDPRLPYQVRLTYYGGREPGKFGLVPYQELRAGPFRLHGPIPLTFQPRELTYALPPGAVDAAGRLELCFRTLTGGAAGVAEVWIERAWVTVKSVRLEPDPPVVGQRVMVRIDLGNRDPRAEHGAELVLFWRAEDPAGDGGPVLHRIVGQRTVHPVPAGKTWQGGLVARLPAEAEGRPLQIGVRRLDRGPWAILKGAMKCGPAGVKQGDLGARDLHVAALAEGLVGVVMQDRVEGFPPGGCRVAVRYRSTQPGELVVRSDDGQVLGTVALAATGGAYRTAEELVRIQPSVAAARFEVAFSTTGSAAVDELMLRAEGDRTSFHLVPVGKVK